MPICFERGPSFLRQLAEVELLAPRLTGRPPAQLPRPPAEGDAMEQLMFKDDQQFLFETLRNLGLAVRPSTVTG
ncbi:hypothetical protein [Actinoplanes siamensis]|nr:hypothetical protein [Actinoplanes siamensis]